MKIGDKVRILAGPCVRVDRTGVLRCREKTVLETEDGFESDCTGRWEVVIDVEYRHLNPCINADGVLGFYPEEMEVIG